ncbi:hypothetical protein PGIGA_G00202670 [Pangasianodon gigas]|uniref:Uncharacterized protein n=1 Tax=Pangasianodon gigas TaxID=30993 RepID=A0ACC5WE90_PANGG|nr:hypothetical protein [Pangasianodon gigas]
MYRKVNGSHPDEKSTNELQLHWQEYCNLVTMLLQWIRHYISVFEESKFPTSYKEIETLCHEFLEFKKTQLPSKEAQTNHSKHIYKAFEGAVQAGQITVPPGYNPIDVEEEWHQLHEAIIKWERLVRNEFERVYRFHEHLVNSHNEYNLHVMSDITVSVNRVPLTHPELDEVMLYYIQDLLAWVEKNQRRIHNSEWGADLPSIESHMGSHHRLHESIKDFKSNIEHAWADENQLSPASKQAYRDYLTKLDLQYNELLSSSVDQLHNLNRLYTFAVAATEELKWLCERKEEELKYDWSDNNTNMTAKKDNYSGLEWDLEQRKISVNTVLATGDKLLKEGHPAQSTIEALIAALQSQWSWLLQLCCCIETHIKENTAYFQFFADVKEAEEKMKKIQETMKKKYRFDRSTTVTNLEHLLKDAEEEMEQLIVFKTHLSSLNRRAKDIVQLKPRNPANPVKDKLLIQAVCDCKQREITVHRGDKCELLNNSQPFKWKVKSLNGRKATVPSICFIIPPPNKEAVESSSGLAASLQELIFLSKKLRMDLKSLLYWQYFMRDMQRINSWNRIMTQEYHEALKSLKHHYHIFMSNSQDSEFFGADKLEQAESAYNNAAQHYKNLPQSKEQGEQDESMCKSYITQIKDIQLRLERYESHMVSCIRQPVDKEPLKACTQGTTEQKKVRTELKGIKKEIDAVVKQSEAALASSQRSIWAPILSSEIDITLKKMEHVYRLSSGYWDKVKSIDLEIHSPQGTEDVLGKYENQLCDVHKVPANEKELESNQAQLKELCCEAEPDKPVEANLRDAMVVNMFGVHSNSKCDHYMSFVASLKEGWQAIVGQVELHLQEVDLLGKQLQAYRQSYDWLIQWIADAKQRQEKIQAKPISDNKVLKELLAQGKKLLEEIKKNEDKVKECENYAIACMNKLKDHEHQLVKYKASLEPFSSIKVESSSDSIIQEIGTLKACYCEVLTLASQYIKCNMAIQSYVEDKEKASEKLNEENRRKMAEMQSGLMDQKFHLPNDERLSGDFKGLMGPATDEKSSYGQLHKRCKVDKESVHMLSPVDKKLLVGGLRKKITLKELLYSQIIDQETYTDLTKGLISVEDLSKDLKKYVEGTSCIAGVYIEVTKERMSIYQAMKKNMIRQDIAIELLEAQAATGYMIDPIKNLKLTVNEAVKMEVVGPEFKDKLLSAEQAVTGYTDPNSGMVISLFQAMKKGLILKDHAIRLLEAQIATGGIIDPKASYHLPVEVAYKRGLFDEELNSILTDPSDDTKGFFDPNTEENLTYLQLLERCMTDPETGLALLLLKEKKSERKTSSKSSVHKCRGVTIDQEIGKEMSVCKAYHKDLIDDQYMERECERKEITSTSKSMITDRRSGHQYGIDDAITRELIDQSSLDQCCAGTLLITESANVLSGDMSGFRSHSSFGSTSSYPMNPVPSNGTPVARTEEMGPIAGILDTDTLKKLSVTQAMQRNLVDSITGQRLLEAQACTGGIIDPNTGERFTVVAAVNKGLVDKIMAERIYLAQKAFQGVEDPRTKIKMSAAQALNERWFRYEDGQRFLEVQYLTGGLIEPDAAGRLSLDDAIKKGILDAHTAQKLQDVSGYSKYLTCPKTKLKISYKDAIERSKIEEGSGLRLLEASSQSIKCLYSPYNINGSGST